MRSLEKEKAQVHKNQILNGEEFIEEKKTRRNKHKKSTFLSIFFNFIFYSGVCGFIIGLFLLYGPYNGFREWYITTAMTTMTHQYLATWFYSDDAIAEVLEKNKMVEVDAITDPSLVTSVASTGNYTYANEYEKEILTRDSAHPDYKIINIEGKGYTGYLAAVYDASKLHTMVTSNLNKSGQYVTTMAQNNKAVLAINGGFFVDLKEDRSGGTPLGITISNGKTITNKAYNDEGGLIGFNTDNKLIIGKVTPDQAKQLNIRDAVTSGPFLIVNGQSSRVVGNGGWGTAPRTAIGQRKDGVVLFLVIDGRKVGRAGAQMNDLIEIMERYGAYNAAALDGGTSSVMVENYKIINDPINSDGVHKTRPVATAWGLILDDSSSSTSNSQTTTKNNTTNSGKKIK
ncbi:MAG TPA: phosphodiester glycosidase family protein [Clostridiaceae bacterium]|jgi:exopolysaccharide biosynthesis protein|nr:phosphodiester glycosidase family protein [Clostridiaceae bacterium]